MPTSVFLMGGLGNWMFQIAFLEYLKNQLGREIHISEHAWTSPHSNIDYMATVFSRWNHLRITTTSPHRIEESYPGMDWIGILNTYPNSLIVGYFQNHNYITKSFLENIRLPSDSIIRNPKIRETVFLHIRGGDYLYPQFSVLNVNLDSYYKRAIEIFPQGTHFSIFTNDIPYAKSKPFINTISHTFIQESEVDSLYLMSQCKGGICANSSFSWWGAFLNPNRTITLPSKWVNDPNKYAAEYYFNGSTTVDV
jgi:hypothetical protein